MRRRIIDFIKYIITSLLVVLMFGSTYYSLSNSFPIEEVDTNESFHNLPINSMDVLVLGSSHAQYSFCPAFFYQNTGLYSYVLGSPCQPLSISYNMLKESLKTQVPSILVLEVFTALPLKEGCEGVTCYISPAFTMTGDEKYDTLNNLPEDKQLLYLNPFVTTHNDWINDDTTFDTIYTNTINTITNTKKEKKLDINLVNGDFGYVENYPFFPVENYWYATNTFKQIDVELLEEDLEALDNIYQLCKENNIKLLLYKTPIDSLNDENLSYLHKVWEWADNIGVPYIDFVDRSPDIDFMMCIHSDSFHSYITGASLLTKEISEYINNNFIIDRHLFNQDLENKYISSTNYYTLSYIDYEYDANKYLKRLINYKGPILIKYQSQGKKSEILSEFLDSYNIKGDSIYLYDNGKLIDHSDSCLGIEYKGYMVYSDFTSMEINGNYYEETPGLTVVIYSEDMSSFKRIETNVKKMWKKGFNWYGE